MQNLYWLGMKSFVLFSFFPQDDQAKKGRTQDWKTYKEKLQFLKKLIILMSSAFMRFSDAIFFSIMVLPILPNCSSDLLIIQGELCNEFS